MLDAHFLELLGDQLSCLDLAEAGFGVGQDLLGETHDLLLALINGLAGPFLQFFDC